MPCGGLTCPTPALAWHCPLKGSGDCGWAGGATAHPCSVRFQVMGISGGLQFTGVTLDESPCLSGLPLLLCEMGVGTDDKAHRCYD